MTTSRAQKLRELMDRKKLVIAAGAHNALSAKLVQRNAFDAVWASGFEISTTYGLPDASILTMSELLEAARAMADAVSLPVIADCDSGFGEALNVAHMVRRYEAAGVAAVCIEDKQFPKVNSFIPDGQRLAPIDEFAGKIRTAKRTQQSADFMVVARVEAFIAGYGLDEALKRATAYADAGADAILIHSKAKTPDEVFSFARAWGRRIPVVIVPTTYFGITWADVEGEGIQVVIHANHGLRAAVRAMNDTLASIQTAGSTRGVEGAIAPMSDLFELQGLTVGGPQS